MGVCEIQRDELMNPLYSIVSVFAGEAQSKTFHFSGVFTDFALVLASSWSVS